MAVRFMGNKVGGGGQQDGKTGKQRRSGMRRERCHMDWNGRSGGGQGESRQEHKAQQFFQGAGTFIMDAGDGHKGAIMWG